MCLVVASSTQTDKITILIGKLRILIYMFDMMHRIRLHVLPIPPAPLTEITISAQYTFSLLPPANRIIVKHPASPLFSFGIPAPSKFHQSGMEVQKKASDFMSNAFFMIPSYHILHGKSYHLLHLTKFYYNTIVKIIAAIARKILIVIPHINFL